MKRSYKLSLLLCCLAIPIVLLTGCGQNKQIEQENNDLHIYTSFYPLYALTEPLLEGVPDTYLHCLVQPQDGCFRDYQLSDWDLTLLTRSADLVIIGGRGLESFENTLYSLGENGPAVASVLYNKELAPAMIVADDDTPTNHWQDYNPHLYLDPSGALMIAETIAAQLTAADPVNADTYMRNLELVNDRLRSVIDEQKHTSVHNSDNKVILMNETAVYCALTLELEIETCIPRESGEAYSDYELEKLINELQNCTSRIILIEEQAPERFCEALEAADFCLVKIDTMSTKRPEEGFEGFVQALRHNISTVNAALAA